MKKLLLILALLLTLPLSSCNANEFTLVYGNIQWGDEVIDNSYDYYISDIPEKDGFNFDGWYEDIDYTKPITKVSAGTKGDIVIFAKFSKEVSLYLRSFNSYSITFNLNGGTFSGATTSITQRVTKNKGLNYPTIPDKNGFLFGGWYDNPAFSRDLFDFSQTINEDLTLYAKWIEPGVASNGSNLFKLNTTKTSMYSNAYYFIPLKPITNLSTTVSDSTMDDMIIYIYDSSGLLKYTMNRTSRFDPSTARISSLNVGEVHRMLVDYDGFGTNNYNVSLLNDFSEIGYPDYSWTYFDKVSLVYGKQFELPMSSGWIYDNSGWLDFNNNNYTYSNGKSLRTFTENVDRLYLYTTNYNNKT